MSKTIEQQVEDFAKDMSADVRWSSGYGQYEKDSAEQQAYIDGVTTAISMMYIGLTGSPKTIGKLTQALQERDRIAKEEGYNEGYEQARQDFENF